MVKKIPLIIDADPGVDDAPVKVGAIVFVRV